MKSTRCLHPSLKKKQPRRMDDGRSCPRSIARAGLFVLLAHLVFPVFADNVDDTDDGEPGEGCGDCESLAPAGPSCEANGSLFWAMKVGHAHYAHTDDFRRFGGGGSKTSSRRSASGTVGGGGGGVGERLKAGAFSGARGSRRGGVSELDDLIARYIDRDPLAVSPVMLEFAEASTDDNHPGLSVRGANLVVRDGVRLGGPLNEKGEPTILPASGRIIQVNSDTATANIEYLSGKSDEFHVRLWPKAGPAHPETGVPVQEVIFTKPEGMERKIVNIERFGASGEYVTCETRKMEGELLTVTTHLGADESGPVIRKETILHSDRGEYIWDYALERHVWEAPTSAGGLMGQELQLVAHTKEIYGDYSRYTNFGLGNDPGFVFRGGRADARRLKEITHDFGGTDLTTKFQYDDAGGNRTKNELGRLLSVRNPDGSWLVNRYQGGPGSSATVTASYSSWLDLPLGSSSSGISTKTMVEAEAITKTIKIGEVEISKTTAAKGMNLSRLIELNVNGGGQASRRTYLPENVWNEGPGRPVSIWNEDGTLTSYEYQHFSDDQLVPGAGSTGQEQLITETRPGLKKKTHYSGFLQVLSEETSDPATGLLLSSKVADLSYGTDNLMRPMKYIYNGDPDDYSIEKYTCCGVTFRRDRTGATTDYAYDGLKRPYRIVEKASATSPEVITTIAYNGLTTTTHRTSGGVTLFVEEVTKNLAGDIVSRKTADEDGDGQPEETTYATTYPGIEGGGNKTRTTTYPDGSTKIETWYRDGRIKSITGTAVPDVHYTYGTHDLNGGGIWTQVTQGSPSGSEWTRTYADSLEREFKVEYPDGATIERTYYSAEAPAGSRGKLATVTDADGVTTGYTYDAEGEIAAVTEAMPGGQERVTTTDTDVVNDSQLATAWRTRKWINGVLVSTDLVSADGRATRSESLGVTATWSQTLPVDGAWTATTTTGDGRKLVRTYAEGRLARSEFFDNQDQSISWTAWTYDPFGRVLTETDSRTGTTTRDAWTDSGNLLSSTDPGGRATAWGYDVMGRTVLIDQPDTVDANGDPVENITRTAYHPTGEIQAVWGDQTNPTYRVYDEQNRLTQLRTWRGLGHGIQPTNGTSGYDPTAWTYDSRRGWLVAKRDAANKGADYTYTPGGRLLTRQWARATGAGSRLTTTYGYDAGKLIATTYNDGTTPGVTYAYDAFGRQTQVTQAGNSWTYAYDPVTLLLASETVTYDTDNDGTGDFTRVLDRSHDAQLRPTGYQLKDGATVEAAAAYTYDDSGRLHTVGDGTDLFTYAYETGSHLVKTLTGPVHAVTNSWDTTRDALLVKENKVGTADISRYEYGVNAIGQRTTLAASGSAFFSARSIGWSYNARGEVTSAAHSDPAQSRFYQYDPIGNRQHTRLGVSADSGGVTFTYSPNSLNQYAGISGSGGLPTFWNRPQPVSHDADGNVLQMPLVDAGFTGRIGGFSWDGENRLTLFSWNHGAGTAMNFYRYDPFGRRISKTVSGHTTLFLYDGWNPIAEYHLDTGNWKLKTSLLFGQDLSGDMQGAGGVGGLLATTDHSVSPAERFHPAYDGNGNVSEYLDGSGTVAAHFEYDPFGQVTVSTDATNRFPVRFSTKWQDFESGLNYYGYRYYDPQQGRWLSRDPIAERGGVNMYGFIGNDPISMIDILGLKECPCEGDKPKVKDDAGRECCEEEMEDIELQVEMGFVGHAQLQLPGQSAPHGWFPSGSLASNVIPGKGQYRAEPHDYDPTRTRKFKSCPSSTKKLKKSIWDNQDGDYSTTNVGGDNCVGWACKRLKDAGFKPPFAGTWPFVQPKDIVP